MDYHSIPNLAGDFVSDDTPYLGDEVGHDDGIELAGYDEVGAPVFRRRFRGQYPQNVGRFQRAAYNRTRALQARNAAQGAAAQAAQHAQAMRAMQAQFAAQRAVLPAPNAANIPEVRFVKDDLLIITATGTAAGAVTKTHLSSFHYYVKKVTFDGSSADAEVTGLAVGKENIIGPLSSDDALPASAFKAGSQQVVDLKGMEIGASEPVILSGAIANANDRLKAILYVKRVIKKPGCQS